MLLKGKTAVLTGCNRGIGRAILELFARNGCDIWACARSSDPEFTQHIDRLKAETGVAITPVYFDLLDSEQVKEASRAIMASKPAIDILVNNAGTIFTAPFPMTPAGKLKEVFEINFFSPFLFTQSIVRIMVRRKTGSIVNISSSAGIEGNEGRAAYASSKAAMISLTKVMSREFGSQNIRVNAIAPGLTDTDMMRSSTSDKALADTLDRTSMMRVGKPEEIADVALFLASDMSSYMTGQVLRVDGGM